MLYYTDYSGYNTRIKIHYFTSFPRLSFALYSGNRGGSFANYGIFNPGDRGYLNGRQSKHHEILCTGNIFIICIAVAYFILMSYILQVSAVLLHCDG